MILKVFFCTAAKLIPLFLFNNIRFIELLQVLLKVLKNDIIEIDSLNEPGCVMNQIGCVIREKITYTAKALKSASLFTISYQDLLEIANHRKDLRKRLDKVVEKNNERSKPIIDFTSRRFYMEGDDGGI